MSALPTSSSPEPISPLAPKLVQFLAQKHAMGYRYKGESRALRELGRFISTRRNTICRTGLSWLAPHCSPDSFCLRRRLLIRTS